MAGISTKAINKLEQNKYKYNGVGFNDDIDLNIYETFYRTLDPQLGRFMQLDPKTTHNESPYVSMANNPVNNIDWLGDYFTWANSSVEDLYGNLKKENGDRITRYK